MGFSPRLLSGTGDGALEYGNFVGEQRFGLRRCQVS